MYRLSLEFTGFIRSGRLWKNEEGELMEIFEFEDEEGVRLSVYLLRDENRIMPAYGTRCMVWTDHAVFIRPAHIASHPKSFRLETL